MAFNLNSFKNIASKSPLEKITGINSSIISDTVARTLGKIGLSSSSISSLSNIAADSILSGAASEFFSENSITRASINDITIGRFSSSVDSAKYSTQVNPENKIGSDVNDSSSGLTYPPDIGEYYIGFAFMDYERPNPFKEAKESNVFLIYLPIPSALSESHTVAWQETSVPDILETLGRTATGNPTGVTAESSLFANKTAALGVAGSIVGGVVGAVGGRNGSRAGAAAGQSIAGSEGLSGLIGQYAGAIPNPNLSVLFQGPTLRQMTFGWRFHPHNPEESDKIRKICNEFKKRMLPNLKFSGASNVLGYPQMVEVKLYPDDYLYKMKKCVINGVTIDYAPNGVPQFFAGTKAPTFIEFTVSLQEIEYFLSEDFGGESGNGVNLNVDIFGTPKDTSQDG